MILTVNYNNKIIPILARHISTADRISKNCDSSLKQEFELESGNSISNLVSAFYEGCVFCWDSVSTDPMEDLSFGLSLDKPLMIKRLYS